MIAVARPPLLALTRAVPPAIVRCELTHLAREPIDVARAADFVTSVFVGAFMQMRLQ